MKEIAKQKAASPDAKIIQFGAFAKSKVEAGGLEAMYKKAHAEIRKDPARKAKKAAKAGAKSKAYNVKRLTHKERTDAAKKKVAALRKTISK